MTEVIESTLEVTPHEFNMVDIHETSLDIIENLEDNNVEPRLGTVALALTLGRVVSPDTMTPEQEQDFLHFIMEAVQVYFYKGPVN